MAGCRGHDVSSAVSNIIAALCSLKETVVKIRGQTLKTGRAARGGKRKGSRSTGHPKQSSSVSERLDHSLETAPAAIRSEYVNGLATHGDRFQAGDNEALACLAATLVKLNTGLVNIISAFLHGGSNGCHSNSNVAKRVDNLDYASLAILSEASRIESCRSLADLRVRLSHKPARPLAAPRPDLPRSARRTSNPRNNKQNASSPKLSNQVQFAFIRSKPRGRRTRSTSAGGSGGSGTTTLINSPSTTPVANLLASPNNKKSITSSDPQRSNRSPDRQNLTPVSPALSGTTVVASPQSPQALIASPKPERKGPRLSRPQPKGQLPPVPPKIPLDGPPSPTPANLETTQKLATPLPRYSQLSNLPQRQPSTRTAATASTRLGEIPLHRWPEQYDFDEMSRLNAQASIVNATHDATAEYARQKHQGASGPCRGLFAKVFRRTPVAGVAGA